MIWKLKLASLVSAIAYRETKKSSFFSQKGNASHSLSQSQGPKEAITPLLPRNAARFILGSQWKNQLFHVTVDKPKLYQQAQLPQIFNK